MFRGRADAVCDADLRAVLHGLGKTLSVSVADPRIRRSPRHWIDIDRHYQALRLEMMALFADIGIACG